MRRVLGLLIIVAVGAGLFAADNRDQALVHQANAEHWYRIEQHSQRGFMHNTVAAQTLTTHINYRAPEAPAVGIHQRLQFADQSPFVGAAYSQRIGDQHNVVSVQLANSGSITPYSATILRNNSLTKPNSRGH